MEGVLNDYITIPYECKVGFHLYIAYVYEIMFIFDMIRFGL